MLSPEYLDACSDPLLKLYEDLEDQIIADIARRIAKTGTLTDTADWQFKVIREIGAVQQDIITRVSQMSGRTEDEIRRLFQESAYINIETNAAPLISNGYAVELDLTPPMRQLIEATFRRTAGDINNLTLTTGATGGNLYYEMCNQAYMQASSGAFSPQEAIWNAVKGAAHEGATVQYAKRRDKLDVAIRRNILTSLNQTAGKITEMNADQLGAEYYETSAHPGARPSHAAWQGRVFKIVGATREYPNFVESTGYGTAGGLCGINCRHSFYPFFPGLSERAYSSDKLAWYRTHTVQYNGEDYTDYEASQIQRAMERSIRESKRRAIAAKAAEDGATDEETKRHLKEKFSEESSILKQKEQRLKDFLKQTGRDAENSRVRVNGFDRSISQKAVWANRRSNSSNPLTRESDITNLMSRRENIGNWPAKGERITKEQLRELVNYGADRKIAVKSFENYDGDIELVKSFIDGISEVAGDYPEILKGKRRLQLRCSYQMEPDDYAETTNNCIVINGNAFRNREALRLDYEKQQEGEKPFFVKGTTYKNISHHESGHLVVQIFGLSPKKMIKGIDTSTVSEYANRTPGEAVAESFSAHYAGVNNLSASQIKKNCDTIIIERRASK